MANTVEVQTLINGPRNLILKVHIDGDGSGEETNKLIVDVSLYDCSEVSIKHVQGSFSGFTAELLWDAAVNTHAFNVPDYDVDQDFCSFGGLINNAGAGKTGDIVMTTTGLGNGDTGHLVLKMKKRGG